MIWGVFGVLGSRGLRKNCLGAREKGHFSFREQGAKTPPGGPEAYTVRIIEELKTG